MSVLTDARVFHDGYRFDTTMDQVSLDYGAEENDETTFGDATRVAAGGLYTAGLAYNGFWEGGSGGADEVLQGDVGQNVPITVSANQAADGDPCYFSRWLWAAYTPFDSVVVGDSHRFAGDAAARENLVRGQYLHNAEVTASGAGAGVQVGSVASDEQLYAILHVIASSGDGSQTLDVVVESDSADDFTGAETTRVTFNQVTTEVGGQWATPIDGAITDDWWRTSHTVGGTGSPAFTYVVAIGIR